MGCGAISQVNDDMKFLVSKKYLRGLAVPCAGFMDLNDAKVFIEKKMELDAAVSVKVVYFISRLNETIATYDPETFKLPSSQSDSGSDKTNKAVFRPTPFNTAPRPPGTPHKWVREEDEDEDKKK